MRRSSFSRDSNFSQRLLRADYIAAAERPLSKYSLLAATTILLVIAAPWDWLSGVKIFWHDSIVALCNMHLLFSSLFSGNLPLWSPEMNAGEPLWPVVETLPGFDPVALVMWPLCFLLKKSPLAAFQWTAVIWLFIFALGGLACSRLILRNWWINLSVFVILFSGPVAWSLPAQTQGFLIPFRYSPWVIYRLFKFLEAPDRKRGIILGSLLAVSVAGYQTPYAVYFYVCLLACFLMARGAGARSLISAVREAWLVFLLSILGAMPTLVAGFKLMSMYPLARFSTPVDYYYPLNDFWKSLTWMRMPAWHGSASLGWPGFVLVVLGFIYVLFQSIQRRRAKSPGASGGGEESLYSSTWALTFIPLSLLCFGLHASHWGQNRIVFGLRNWGFLLTPIIFTMTMMIPSGFRALCRLLPRVPVPFLSMLCFCSVLAQMLIFAPSHQYALPYQESLASRMPPFHRIHALILPKTRPYAFDWREYVPFHYQGPALQFKMAAYMEPVVGVVREALHITNSTHQVRLPRYQSLMAVPGEGSSSASRLRRQKDLREAVLGVSLPILREVRHCDSAGNPKQAADMLGQRRAPWKLKDWAIIEGLGAKPCPDATPGGNAAIEVTHYDPATLEVRVRAPSPRVLIWSDNWDRDWSASIGGEPATLGIANLTEKAVRVPAGASVVRFKYAPLPYLIAFWSRSLFYLAWAVYGLCWLGSKIMPML